MSNMPDLKSVRFIAQRLGGRLLNALVEDFGELIGRFLESGEQTYARFAEEWRKAGMVRMLYARPPGMRAAVFMHTMYRAVCSHFPEDVAAEENVPRARATLFCLFTVYHTQLEPKVKVHVDPQLWKTLCELKNVLDDDARKVFDGLNGALYFSLLPLQKDNEMYGDLVAAHASAGQRNQVAAFWQRGIDIGPGVLPLDLKLDNIEETIKEYVLAKNEILDRMGYSEPPPHLSAAPTFRDALSLVDMNVVDAFENGKNKFAERRENIVARGTMPLHAEVSLEIDATPSVIPDPALVSFEDNDIFRAPAAKRSRVETPSRTPDLGDSSDMDSFDEDDLDEEDQERLQAMLRGK